MSNGVGVTSSSLQVSPPFVERVYQLVGGDLGDDVPGSHGVAGLGIGHLPLSP
jgi:hypothetical protein